MRGSRDFDAHRDVDGPVLERYPLALFLAHRRPPLRTAPIVVITQAPLQLLTKREKAKY